jgi:guanylate kinase
MPMHEKENGRGGRGILFVISSPSGGGKTTLCRRLLSGVPGLGLSVSHTTRPRREGEREGVEYHFVDEASFARMREAGEFLESARVYGHSYGTSRKAVERVLACGEDVLLDIDVQGALHIRERFPGAVLVFILPPGLGELRRRLSARGTEDENTVELRLAAAKMELAEVERYDYAVLNDDLQDAYDVLRAVLVAERCRVGRRSA